MRRRTTPSKAPEIIQKINSHVSRKIGLDQEGHSTVSFASKTIPRQIAQTFAIVEQAGFAPLQSNIKMHAKILPNNNGLELIWHDLYEIRSVIVKHTTKPRFCK